MESNKFWNVLTTAIDLPFLEEDVKEISSNDKTVWIELNDGDTYYLTIQKCEPSED
jgi:hypothetical protein